MSFIYKRLPAPWRTQDTFQAGILNLICFPLPPFNKLAVPRLQEKLEAALRTRAVLSPVGQAPRTQGLSKVRDSPRIHSKAIAS